MNTLQFLIRYSSKYYFLSVIVVYVLGFLIYNINISYFFRYLPIKDFKLLNYLASGLWWIGTLLFFHSTMIYLRKIFKVKHKAFLNFFLIVSSFILILIALLFLNFFISKRGSGLMDFMLFPFEIILRRYYYEFFVEKLFRFLTNSTFYIFVLSGFFISKMLEDKIHSVKKGVLVLLLFINLIGFSNSVFSRIPKSLGGGKLVSVSVVFKKGYIPNELSGMLKNNYYRALLLDQDEESYYIAFSHSSESSFDLYYYWMEFRRNAFIIPKENIVALKIH